MCCQYVANRKHLRQRLKESKGSVSVSSLRNGGRLFHADGPAQENAQNHRQTDGWTDNIIMPIADHSAVQYYRLKHT